MSLARSRGLLALMFVILAGTTAAAAQQSQRTRSPHGNLEIACQNCHASESWRPIRAFPEFDHNSQTKYPLLGQHRSVACASCHVTPVFGETAQTCSSCHADIHRRQFGASCENCHSVQGWRIRADAANAHTNRFPLAGGHLLATCESCHRGAATGTYTGLDTACVVCHAQDYAAAQTVDHAAAGFSTNCESCHTLNRWQYTGQFEHARTQFPLTGAHTSVQCSSCHPANQFSGIPTDCASCHAAAFAATTAPNHPSSGFPQDCVLCHSTSAWTPAALDHSRTRFPLLGAHTSAACSSCHIQGTFTGTPTTCVSCHLADFTGTTAPSHVAANLPQDCQLCHTAVQWQGATFDHSKTTFPLTGAHTSVACLNCHVGNQFTGTPTACYSCHSSEFTAVTNPNHVAAGLPTTCESCHTTTTWTGARLTHKFPIYSGAHAGRWSTCNECHTNSSNYTVFNCLNCHEHSKTLMDDKHAGRTGYVYDSLACYGCHPQGTH